MKKLGLLISIVFFAITACAPEAASPVVQEAPKPSDYTRLEATIFVGNWQGACKDNSWMVFVQASDSGSVTLLEGNPNIGLTAIKHKAPGAFFSGCMYVRLVPELKKSEIDYWKVKIYGLP